MMGRGIREERIEGAGRNEEEGDEKRGMWAERIEGAGRYDKERDEGQGNVGRGGECGKRGIQEE